MNPIFTKTNENNLKGYLYDEFISEFDTICQDHLDTERAKKFAFILYDFNSATHKALEDRAVFTELDRISGKRITIFYLDAKPDKSRGSSQNMIFENFNDILLKLTDRHIRNIPFIIFFDYKKNDVSNFKSYSIRDDDKFILNDLSASLTLELKNDERKIKLVISSLLKNIIEETPKILYSEFIKQLFKGITS